MFFRVGAPECAIILLLLLIVAGSIAFAIWSRQR